MADTVLKKNTDHFTNQAQLHRTVADHTRQMLSQYKVLHENMVTVVQSSSIGPALPNCLDWWESFQTHLSKHADLHEQMADHLEKSVIRFDKTDEDIQQKFSVQDPGFSS